MLISLIAAASLATAAPTFSEKPCADARLAKVARCGTVEVPEDRTSSGSRVVPLNVIVLRAAAPKPDMPPLFDIDGGPGLPATKNAEFYLSFGAAYRARRDIVLVDQRGTGASKPLNCPELDASETSYIEMFPADAVARCREALSRTADITRYGTSEAVADLDAVRAALGHPRIDIFGLSYGTTVALHYLSTYPERVRAAVLMGVAPPDAMPPRYHAVAGQRALDLLFEDCAADPSCHAAFPDPVEDFDRALVRLGQGSELSAEIFAEKLRTLMYSPKTARGIPFILSRAAEGDLAPFHEATRPRERMPYSNGMFLSVTCAEGIARMPFDDAVRAARATKFGDYRLRRQRKACGEWLIDPVAAEHPAPIRSDSAVLLISGRLDPVTPPEWAEQVKQSLPNARHLVIPAGGHILDGLSGADTCFDPIILKFFESGDARSLDATCLDAMRPPPFKLPDAR